MSSWIMASRNQHGEGNTSLLRPGKWDSEMMKNTSTTADPLLGAALYHAACKLLTRGRALMKNRKGGKKILTERENVICVIYLSEYFRVGRGGRA